MRPALVIPVLLLLAPAAHAQEDACAEAEPCTWVVQIDEDGLAAPGGDLRGTVGDWYVFEFQNVDPDQGHEVTFSYDGSSWDVAYLSEETSDPFELAEAGTFQLEDNVTGDTLPVQVVFEDVSDGDDGNGSAGEEDGVSIPGAPGAWLALAIAALALVSRRR